MEVVLLIKDAFGELLSLCDTLEEAEEMVDRWKEAGIEANASRGVIHESGILDYSKNVMLLDVYEVSGASGECFYCRAHGISDALVEACIVWSDRFEPLRVRVYDAEDLMEREAVPHGEETYELTQLTRNILRRLSYDNRDLCALAIEYTNELETEEELLDLEISMHTYREENNLTRPVGQGMKYIPVEEQTAEGIRQIARNVWYDWMFFESTDPSPAIFAWIKEGRTSADVTDTLVRTFMLQRWGGYECRYPYALYRGIMNRTFDSYCEKYAEIRRIFER